MALAAALARAGKAKLRLVLVHQQPGAPQTPEAAKAYTKIELATRRAERGYLSGVAARLKQQGCADVTRVTLVRVHLVGLLARGLRPCRSDARSLGCLTRLTYRSSLPTRCGESRERGQQRNRGSNAGVQEATAGGVLAPV